uniref:tRNA (guanine(9)-N(1))-methyltransferase n=1 Tax=Tetraselmis chuii TaxID=63592 RepID=A0A7S1SNN9_9CHLO|mmetsp:Transcript_21039/g.37495  ORF Transcript_21039/g.37495 Transcript_21039/m.37495 type:complete len:470 (+) Transcript_21039:187-1596(+)|eukprot:CAMPEP_0177774466 /NCGR_PEP_ID=MMETSP0491_2-20121128/13518_1 /TAXON_ID=63592 /ORGANISM="Tetraselmis chuii, Strain PLY429" /LENGTH=469 /DNA_ID=CAMNT_0019292839 /DNA_START=185 /DNA_END=1594 /DNA_ORIENTATION=+
MWQEGVEEEPHFLHHVDSCKVFASEEYAKEHFPSQQHQHRPSQLAMEGNNSEPGGDDEQSPPVNTGHLRHQDSVQLTHKHLSERSPNPDKPLKFKVGEYEGSPQESDGLDSDGEQHLQHVDSAVLIRKHPPHHTPSRLGNTKFQLGHPGLVEAKSNDDGESEDVEEGDNADSEAAVSQGDTAEAARPMSKTQQKKIAKKQRMAEFKAQKKAAAKAEKAAQMEVRKAEKDAKMANMTEEERKAYFEEMQAKKAERRAEQEAKKEKLKVAMESGQRLVIDLDFEDKMNETEIRSLCQQLSYSYSANCHSEKPFHLHLSSLKGHIESTLRHQAAGVDNWSISKDAACYTETFTQNKEDIVYLTADSPDTLSELDPSKIYIIGGIVDRNRHKHICLERAKAAGVATAALPIGPHLKLAGSKVLTVNQVVEIMLRYVECKDWKEALLKVIPERKRDAEESDGGDTGAEAKRQKG